MFVTFNDFTEMSSFVCCEVLADSTYFTGHFLPRLIFSSANAYLETEHLAAEKSFFYS